MSTTSDATKRGGAATRGRAKPKTGNAKAGGGSTQRRPSAAKRTTAAKSPRSGTRTAGTTASQSQTQNGKGHSQNGSGSSHEALTAFGMSVAGASVGLAGGLLLGRRALRRHRSVLGVAVPDQVDFAGLASKIGGAGREFGRLAGELNAVRRKAEQIGHVLG